MEEECLRLIKIWPCNKFWGLERLFSKIKLNQTSDLDIIIYKFLSFNFNNSRYEKFEESRKLTPKLIELLQHMMLKKLAERLLPVF
jgi:predicted membrane chloride channel (bestrophin family)